MKPSGASEKILSLSVEFLTAWEKGALTLDDCLDQLRREPGFEKTAVASLLFEYFRHKGFIDSLIAKHAKKDSIRQKMRVLLCCAATQIFFQTGLAQQSAVNIAVDFAKYRGGQGAGGFVNAMLRSLLRDRSVDPANIPASFPSLLRDRWTTAFGKERADSVISVFASNPPLCFRVRKELSSEMLTSLSAVPVEGLDFTGTFKFYETSDPDAVMNSGLLDTMDIYIQDPATTMAFSLPGVRWEGKILDACAAPGGKTILISDSSDPAKVKLSAMDRSARRLPSLNGNLHRAKVRCRAVAADACETPFFPESFDVVLADVPCSNSGVLRRRPDAPWRFTEKRLNELSILQGNILDSLGRLVKPGGFLLYSTCSIEAEEDSEAVRAFLVRFPEFSLEAERLLLPGPKHDGAFAALLRKK